ncbi:MAG: short-chain dehydrogenase, partial [Planctomycetota bacterium]
MADGLFDLEGKVAVVSGAASGLGRASALALAAH